VTVNSVEHSASRAAEQTDEQTVVRSWSPDPRNVGTARDLLLKTLADWGRDELADKALLVLSELLTNAVRHADAPRGREVETRFMRTGEGARIEVHDATERRPVRRIAGVDSAGGRGLLLVNAVADTWGCLPRKGGGKVVWAQINAVSRTGDGDGV
jgi:serine/threonine-protein kinase RsbW